ncbi:iron chelate uptake ABC transporter family permease subunit [Enterocloster asparagiformis]
MLPASLLLGASFLLVVDNFARLLATSEIPIGILTAFVGAPFFLWLILREGNKL